jgi:hypothetical protein
MNVHQLIVFMDFMMSVRNIAFIKLFKAREDTQLNYGRHLRIVSTVFQWLQS